MTRSISPTFAAEQAYLDAPLSAVSPRKDKVADKVGHRWDHHTNEVVTTFLNNASRTVVAGPPLKSSLTVPGKMPDRVPAVQPSTLAQEYYAMSR